MQYISISYQQVRCTRNSMHLDLLEMGKVENHCVNLLSVLVVHSGAMTSTKESELVSTLTLFLYKHFLV